MSNQKHLFHLVDPSPWPLLSSLAAYGLTSGMVFYFHGYSGSFTFLFFSVLMVVYCMFVWWSDIISEGTFGGYHTLVVQKGLKIGVIFFIASEIMFFFAFFWAFFHSSFAPSVAIGSIWPPSGIHVLNPWDVPFLNTIILLTSGATVTWCHHAIMIGVRYEALYSLFLTIVLAILFLFLQFYEYKEAPFDISDGVYGSTFYMATGFHGFHVLVGTMFLIVCWFSLYKYHFNSNHHIGFEAAAWYWHFVDVVWLFLFVSIYWWGSL